MKHVIVTRNELPLSGSVHRFEVCSHGNANASFFLPDTPERGSEDTTPICRYRSRPGAPPEASKPMPETIVVGSRIGERRLGAP